ncbi:arylsulfatase B [Ixodes scapularis]
MALTLPSQPLRTHGPHSPHSPHSPHNPRSPHTLEFSWFRNSLTLTSPVKMRGWADVSFRGDPQIPTPNLDVLASQGIILNNYYVQPLCAPSRGALMSGLYPIHTGLQHLVPNPGEPWGLPTNLTIMPEYLKNLGYATHMIGKWHLGYYKESYTPTRRGFDSFYGYLNGGEDYYDHTIFWRAPLSAARRTAGSVPASPWVRTAGGAPRSSAARHG